MRHLLRTCAILAATLALAASAQAQAAYPSKFVRIVVGYSAGGGTDVVARVIGEKLSERLGQPVVIENKPGGGARLAVEYVAKEPPDGYTVLIGGGSEMAISPLIYKTGYSPLTSFQPLTIAIEMPLILLVAPDHPAKTAPELVAWAKANPDKSNYATTAPGAASWATFTPPGVVNLVKEGKLRALAVTTAKRSPDLPDVPTMQELDIDIAITNWNGFFAPAGTPKPVADKLAKEIRHIVLDTEVKDKLRAMFTDPVGKTPAQTLHHIENDLTTWKAVIEQANLKF
jgi:tripartite-type tricarboxylate transporter receptor subunit TctC